MKALILSLLVPVVFGLMACDTTSDASVMGTDSGTDLAADSETDKSADSETEVTNDTETDSGTDSETSDTTDTDTDDLNDTDDTDDPDDTDTNGASYSCQYENMFAGKDCKEYVGSNWEDSTARQENCGSGFVEQNAKLVDEACPETVEVDGEPTLAIGVCRVEVGEPGEYHLYSYEGALGPMQQACSSMMQGQWETLDGAHGDGEIHPTLPEAFDALQSTVDVEVSSQCATEQCLFEMIDNQETFDFTPVGIDPIAGFVFYPGGNVDPRAYAPSAFALAEGGVFVSIVPMKDYLVLDGYERATDVIAASPEISHWFVGGHSMGGTMAARYGTTQAGKGIDGIVMWGSVTGEEYDISDTGQAVLLVYGTLETVTTEETVEMYRHNLPEDVIILPIEGGDHSQFGYYEDDQPPATISREEQQHHTIEVTVDFIEAVII